MPRLGKCRLLCLLVSLAVVAPCGCRRSDKNKSSGRRPRLARIVLDPGHGGRDPGAWLERGYPEKNLVLDIALFVERLLRQKGFQVILTRRSDEYVSLWKRVEIANDRKASLFVSIHANCCDTEAVSGFEVYYAANGRESESLKAAEFLRRHFKEATGARDRGIRNRRFLVLTQTRCPSLLLEVGYLSNREEAKLLRKRSYEKKVAEGIANGIAAYVKRQR